MIRGLRYFVASSLIFLSCIVYIPMLIIAALVCPVVALNHLDKLASSRSEIARIVTTSLHPK